MLLGIVKTEMANCFPEVSDFLLKGSPQNTSILVSPDFVCVEVLQLSQPNGVMSSAINLPNHMFTGQT